MLKLEKKQKMYHTHFLSNNPRKVIEFKKYANLLAHLKEKTKKEFYRSQFEKCKNNLKTTWKLVGTLVNRKTKGQTIPNKILADNRIYTKQSDIVERFNNYFVNIGPELASKIADNNICPTQFINKSPTSSFNLCPVTEPQVFTLLSGLNERKSYTNIPIKLIKMASGLLTSPFTKIFNESIATGSVPEVFKVSRITPIYKSGSPTELGNYRPIAVISPFSKIFERMIYDQLLFYLEKHNILFNYQFGFRKGYSTEYAILETIENLKTAIDENRITCGIFLDFSKAFDTINHNILLAKMNKYGIRGLPLEWFSSYLKERKQYVKIGNNESSKKTITCGIPQGSTLGPLLFLLYINDLPNCSDKLLFRLFADDTNIFYSSGSARDLETVVNQELTKILEYCAANKLSINFKKTNYMLITSPRKKTNLSITACNIQRKEYIKYLGVYIDENLKWDTQIAHINNKIAKNTGILFKLRHYVSIRTLKHLYYTLIYPYLNYALMSWGTASKSRLETVQVKQNKCIRSIFFARNRESPHIYYKLLEILKLKNIFNLKICILVYRIKYIKTKIPSAFLDLIPSVSEIHCYNTRYSANHNLYRPSSRTNYGLSRFKAISSRTWEKIPLNIKQLSFNRFKSQYKLYLLDNQN